MVTTPATWKAQELLHADDLDATDQLHDQEDPAVVSIGGGRYLVAWTEKEGGPVAPSAGDDIVGRIFDALGNPVGPELQLNASVSGKDEGGVALAGRPGGGFVVVYQSFDSGTAASSIHIDTYDIDGNIVSGHASTIVDTPIPVGNPEIAMAPDGSYLVTYDVYRGGRRQSH